MQHLAVLTCPGGKGECVCPRSEVKGMGEGTLDADLHCGSVLTGVL